jgi:hypothetical protein
MDGWMERAYNANEVALEDGGMRSIHADGDARRMW